jgi:hypothetical protein
LTLGILCEKILSVLFGKIAAKRTKNGVWRVSRLRARRGLRALDLRRLLKKAGENFSLWGVTNLLSPLDIYIFLML